VDDPNNKWIDSPERRGTVNSKVEAFLIQTRQQTLAKMVFCSGMGVHSGKIVNMTIHPAPINHGIQFVRKDLTGSPRISAHFNQVVDTSLATVIGSEGCIVSTIEHLMATFAGLSIDNALVELDSYEVPIMDGSAGPFTRLVRSAGTTAQSGPKCYFVIKKPIAIESEGKSVSVYPEPTTRITCTIEFPHPMIKRQTYSIEVTPDRFEKEISPARTFGFLHEVEYMKRYGLARGGSLDNAVVIGDNGVVNEGGLRFPDEFVRHKILDCIGDFSLLGLPIIGHIVTHRSGHAFNHAFLKTLFSRKESWETITINNADDITRLQGPIGFRSEPI
jgi:UDP-3-O-[3-hydroxymyristoyl] N-acetylglucosamine deacetylase